MVLAALLWTALPAVVLYLGVSGQPFVVNGWVQMGGGVVVLGTAVFELRERYGSAMVLLGRGVSLRVLGGSLLGRFDLVLLCLALSGTMAVSSVLAYESWPVLAAACYGLWEYRRGGEGRRALGVLLVIGLLAGSLYVVGAWSDAGVVTRLLPAFAGGALSGLSVLCDGRAGYRLRSGLLGSGAMANRGFLVRMVGVGWWHVLVGSFCLVVGYVGGPGVGFWTAVALFSAGGVCLGVGRLSVLASGLVEGRLGWSLGGYVAPVMGVCWLGLVGGVSGVSMVYLVMGMLGVVLSNFLVGVRVSLFGQLVVIGFWVRTVLWLALDPYLAPLLGPAHGYLALGGWWGSVGLWFYVLRRWWWRRAEFWVLGMTVLVMALVGGLLLLGGTNGLFE